MTIRPFSRNGNYHIDVDAALVSQDFDDNFSIIYWRMFVIRTDGGPGIMSGPSFANSGWVDTNVRRVWHQTNLSYDYRGQSPYIVMEGTFRVDHRIDGRAEYEVSGTMNLGAIGTAIATTGVRSLPPLAFVPEAPHPIGFSEITQNSIRYHFAGRGNGGSPILEWEALFQDATINGPQISYHSNGYTILGPGLIPGHSYNFWSRGRNMVGWGPWSTGLTTRTVAGARAKHLGVWKEAVPHVKVNGNWRYAQMYRKIDGTWRKSI